MSDYLDEEMQIMNERANEEDSMLSMATFKQTIDHLKLSETESVGENDSVAEAVAKMQNKKIGSLVVVKDREIVGIITERDVLNKVVGKIKDLNKAKVSEIMTPDPVTLRTTDMIAHVMHNMHIGRYRHVPILNEKDEPVAVVSIKDVMSFIIERFPREIINVEAEPYRGPAKRDGG